MSFTANVVPPFTQDLQGQATADAGGNATIQLGGPQSWREWQVSGLVVDSDGVLNPNATAYRNSVSATNIVAFTRVGRRDTARGRVLIQSGERLFVVFAGASVGSRCSCTVTIQNRPGK